jgi:glycosyltransferase involved in cell wall biosynthesis
VVACGYPDAVAYERSGDLTVHRIGGRVTVFPHAVVRQWRGLVPDADVVLEIFNGISFLTPLWLRTPRVVLVHHIHRGHYVAELGPKGRIAAFVLETLPLRVLYRRAPFLTVSQSSADEIAEHGIAPEQIAVNHNGVDTAALGPGAKASEPTLLYLGRLKRYKRLEWLLDVVEGVPGAVLDIAGDGDHREEFEHEIAARGLRDRVRMHGHVDEATKLRLLQRAWVHVTASSAEGWSLTVMEAAACGTPTVAAAAGGMRESVVHERTGLLADDAVGLTDATWRLVADHALRERLAAAGLARARELTWDRCALATLQELEAARVRAAQGQAAHVGARVIAGGAVAANAAAVLLVGLLGVLLVAMGVGVAAALGVGAGVYVIPLGVTLTRTRRARVAAATDAGT